MLRNGLIRETGFVQSPEQPIAAAVAGKNSTGAIAAVRRGRESDNQQTRVRVAKTRHRLAPIVLLCKPLYFLARDSLAPCNQAYAPAALLLFIVQVCDALRP